MKNYVLRKWYKGKDHRKLSYSKDVDKELVPMLDVFNNIPGVRTIYSCCGHGYPGWYLTFKTTSDYMYRELYRYFTKQGDGLGLFPGLTSMLRQTSQSNVVLFLRSGSPSDATSWVC